MPQQLFRIFKFQFIVPLCGTETIDLAVDAMLCIAEKRIPTVATLPRNDKVFDSGSVYRPPLSLRGLLASRGNPFSSTNYLSS